MATTTDPLNEIAYWKTIAEQKKAAGDTAGLGYASKQAQQYYDMLSKTNPTLATEVSKTNAAGLADIRKQQNGTYYGSNGSTGVADSGVANSGGGSGDGSLNPSSGITATGNAGDPNNPTLDQSQFPAGFFDAWMAQNEATQKQPQGPTMTDQLLQQLMDILNGQQVDQAALQQKADQEAAEQANEQKAAYQRLIDSLVSGQDAALGSVNSNLATSRQDLQDTSFQDYLRARQNIASRGLAGSGLADAQNTQLLLANGRQLAGLGRDAQSQIAQVRADYGSKLADANAQLSGVNQNKMAQQIYDQLYGQAQGTLNDKADRYLDLIGKTIGYDKINAGDAANLQFDYDKLGVDNQQFYDKLGADQKLEYEKMNQNDRQFYAKLNNDSRQFYDKLNSDYNISLTSIMGVDKDGNPTIDNQKLAEEIRKNKADEDFNNTNLNAQVANWTAQNEIDTSKIQLSYDQLKQKTDNDAAMVNIAIAGAQNDTDRTVLTGLKTQLDAVSQRISDKTKALKPGQVLPQNDPDVAAYNSLLNSITGVINPKSSASSGKDRPAVGALNFTPQRTVTGSYSNEINTEAKANDIDAGLVKAVAQQESSLGQGSNNVMQVNGMNGATPAQSIATGTRMLASYVKKYGNVEMALAAYNMGPGVIDYMQQQGIVNVREGMQRFSEYQKQKYGYKVYGDPQYIDHVLRYYT
jgi:hypothetical protein